MERGLVSCEWLHEELQRLGDERESLRLVDATWYMPNTPFAAPEGSPGAHEEFLAGPRLPGALFFDIDGVATFTEDNLPHMLPGEETFSAAMAALRITPSTRVVVYDKLGIFSAPRFWYTLKVAFGHPAEVAVLNGGLPRWRELGLPLEEGDMTAAPEPSPVATWARAQSASWDLAQVRENIAGKRAEFVDARSLARFVGDAPEPREGLRGGHVPGSLNMPFVDLLSEGPIFMYKPRGLLQGILQKAGLFVQPAELQEKEFVTSCGSGLTACVVGLALHLVGMPLSRWAVYDGAWCEWGADKGTPVMRGPIGAEEPVD